MNFAVREDRSLFVAFALLNAIGYNSESGLHFSDVRKDVRLSLAAHAANWRHKLDCEGLLEPLLRSGGAMLMDVLPYSSFRDDFSRQIEECSTNWQRASRSALNGIDQWLSAFSSELPLESLWIKHRKSYETAASLLGSVIPRLQSLAARCSDENNNVSVQLEPNLLDAHGRGYSVSTPGQTWLYLGPLKNLMEAETLAVHELLHRWVDPASEHVLLTDDLSELMPRAKAQFRIVAESYPEVAIWLGETVVRAATAWLVPKSVEVMFSNEDELPIFWERAGFIGFSDAYAYVINEPKRSLEDVLSDAVLLVYERLQRW
jgi:hypothetical protein